MIFFPDVFTPYMEGRETAIDANWADYQRNLDAELAMLRNREANMNLNVYQEAYPGVMALARAESEQQITKGPQLMSDKYDALRRNYRQYGRGGWGGGGGGGRVAMPTTPEDKSLLARVNRGDLDPTKPPPQVSSNPRAAELWSKSDFRGALTAAGVPLVPPKPSTWQQFWGHDMAEGLFQLGNDINSWIQGRPPQVVAQAAPTARSNAPQYPQGTSGRYVGRLDPPGVGGGDPIPALDGRTGSGSQLTYGPATVSLTAPPSLQTSLQNAAGTRRSFAPAAVPASLEPLLGATALKTGTQQPSKPVSLTSLSAPLPASSYHIPPANNFRWLVRDESGGITYRSSPPPRVSSAAPLATTPIQPAPMTASATFNPESAIPAGRAGRLIAALAQAGTMPASFANVNRTEAPYLPPAYPAAPAVMGPLPVAEPIQPIAALTQALPDATVLPELDAQAEGALANAVADASAMLPPPGQLVDPALDWAIRMELSEGGTKVIPPDEYYLVLAQLQAASPVRAAPVVSASYMPDDQVLNLDPSVVQAAANFWS